ncbi:hypothetical protein GCM10009677_10770 [Sphaerisporangium rubeum]
MGVTLPDFTQAKIESADLTECPPVEYQADSVVVLYFGDRPVLSVVVEVQNSRDTGKRWSWPVYLASVRARHRCPAVLLVICTEHTIAQWCATPIEMGHPGWCLAPIVAGPRSVPPITDPAVATEAPELAVFSAIAHNDDAETQRVLNALLPALSCIDQERSQLYADFVYSMLPEAAKKHMEVLMNLTKSNYPSSLAQAFFDEGEAKGEAKGKAKGKTTGKAEAVLIFLETRGITVTDEQRDRVLACTDMDRLDEWIRQAATADTSAFLFA